MIRGIDMAAKTSTERVREWRNRQYGKGLCITCGKRRRRKYRTKCATCAKNDILYVQQSRENGD